MEQKYLAAVVQMSSGEDKDANLAMAEDLISSAAARGASLIVAPELFTCIGPPGAMVAAAETIPGPTSERMAALAARLGVTLVAGSIGERIEGSAKIYNTSVIFGPDGRMVSRYRKTHLFDIDLPGGVTHQESCTFEAGAEIAVADTPLGRLGQAICYDLRFPLLFRRLASHEVEVICVPSAFTLATGRDHWEVLLRARAIENQAYVLAANQHGRHGDIVTTYGRSMIVDPWGIVLANAADGPGYCVAEIDRQRVARVRAQLPCLRHQREL